MYQTHGHYSLGNKKMNPLSCFHQTFLVQIGLRLNSITMHIDPPCVLLVYPCFFVWVWVFACVNAQLNFEFHTYVLHSTLLMESSPTRKMCLYLPSLSPPLRLSWTPSSKYYQSFTRVLFKRWTYVFVLRTREQACINTEFVIQNVYTMSN